MHEVRDGSIFLEPDRFGSKNRRFGLISRRNRQLGLGIEEMQTAGLRRKADLVTPRDGGFRRHPGGGNAGAAYSRLQQDLGAELFDHLDTGIETKARGAVAECEVLRPYAQDHTATAVGCER
jgi:hypothetical protein